jgi:asparagine synthase (glutamine-hydrolysing)
MPGIVGIIGISHPGENASALNQMVKCMMYEPFYTSGTYVNEALGLWVGWIAHEGSFSDCMPIWNETKDICLIFSGEDFMDPTEVESLKGKGHKCDSQNATYLVHLYEEMGLKFVEKLNGWFSGVLVDLRQRSIVLFNDRYGLGRIYYHENEDGFYFSSEAKSLLKVLPELRELDTQGLAETFSCGCVLRNRTLFPKVALPPGGSMWMFNGTHNIRKGSYFTRKVWENQPLLSGADYYGKLKETFARIVLRYLPGARKVAMSLTGGLDGRMIMAWINPTPGGLPCYTFGGPYRDCADVKIARKIARLCGQSHETIMVGSQFLDEFPSLAEKAVFVSDGTMDVTGSVELYVNRIARQIAPVRLTGNYGSEILRGSVMFRPGFLDEKLLEPEFAQLVRDASATYSRERRGHPVSFIAFKQVPWYHYSRLAVEQSQLTLRSPYLDNDLVSLMYQAPPELILSKEPSLRLIAEGNADLARIPTDRGILYRPSPLIGKIQRAYQEFTVKSEYAYDYGMPQWLAEIDHVLEALHLERLFLGRHKFYHFRVWYRDKLSQYVKDVLLDPRTRNRPYLDGRCLEKVVNSHINGHRNYTSEIHRILTTELLQRQLVEQR